MCLYFASSGMLPVQRYNNSLMLKIANTIYAARKFSAYTLPISHSVPLMSTRIQYSIHAMPRCSKCINPTTHIMLLIQYSPFLHMTQ